MINNQERDRLTPNRIKTVILTWLRILESLATRPLVVAFCQHFFGLLLDTVSFNRDCDNYPDAARLMDKAQERQ